MRNMIKPVRKFIRVKRYPCDFISDSRTLRSLEVNDKLIAKELLKS